MVSPTPQPLALVWFRDDLRLTDNAALTWAAQHGHVVGLFIFEEIDAAPYFRIFSPLLQEEKFDPQGIYINQWVPGRHTPMYPEPMVDAKESRKTALAAYDDIKS